MQSASRCLTLTTDQFERECERAARSELAFGAEWESDAITAACRRAAFAHFALLSYCSGAYAARCIRGVERAYRRILADS